MAVKALGFWSISATVFVICVGTAVAAVWAVPLGSTTIAPILGLTTALFAGLAIASFAVAVRLTLWRRALDGGQTSIVPDRLLAAFDGTAADANKAFDAADAAARQASAAAGRIGDGIERIEASLAIFRDGLNQKDVEIDRLRQVGDAHVFRRFLHRFLRAHDVILEEIADLAASGGDVGPLDAARAILEDALAECGVFPFEPGIGDDYRTAFGVSENPARTPTDDPDQDFTIAEVRRRGFQLDGADGPEAIRPADVTIFVHEHVEAAA